MAKRSNRRSVVAPPLALALTLTELEASHHGDHRAFLLNFSGTQVDVTVTDKTSAVRRWIRNVRHFNRNFLRRRRLVVGLGLGDELKNDSVSTIHMCVGRESIIIQFDQLLEARRRRRSGVPEILSHLFSDKRIMFVGISNGRHATKLEKSGIHVANNIHNLKDWLGFEENQNPSYKEVIEAAKTIHQSYSRFDLNPQVTYSNWSKPELDDEQISQAAADAFLRYKIGVKYVYN